MALIGRVEDAGGLWRSADQMEEALGQLKNTSRGEAKRKCLDAIKAQMTYRKRILQQAAVSAKDFCFSENGRALNVEQLKARLQILIDRCANVEPRNE